MTANEFISQFCIGSIRRVFPGEYLDCTIAQIQEDAAAALLLRTRPLSFSSSKDLENRTMSHKLFEIMRALEEAKVHFFLSRQRDDSVMLSATFVGERIEIDVFEDGHIEYSRFPGSEDVIRDLDPLLALIEAARLENE